MTWNPPAPADYDADSICDVELMTEIVQSLKHGRDGSGDIDGATIQDASIPVGKLGGGAISQGQLNTTVGTVSVSGATSGHLVTLTLPGGSYGFWPQIRHSGSAQDDTMNAVVLGEDPSSPPHTVDRVTVTTSSVAYIALSQGSAATGATGYADQRYVQASPPYDLGDGEIGLFVFAKVDQNGDILATYEAEDPPWANNGPTNTRPDIYKRVRRNGRTELAGFQLNRRLNRETGEVAEQVIEVTQGVKNADMPLIPHPFIASLKPGERVVLLDPPDTGWLREIHGAGECMADLLKQRYLELDNQPVNRACPKNVQACRFRWRNTKRGS